MTEEKIYHVTTEGDEEGKSIITLGYARGEPELIKAYYDHKKEYSIRLTEITIENVDTPTANERLRLLKREAELDTEKTDLEKRLKRLGVRLHR